MLSAVLPAEEDLGANGASSTDTSDSEQQSEHCPTQTGSWLHTLTSVGGKAA